MKIDLSENLVDINQLVSFFNISLSEANEWIDQGIIPPETYVKVGNTYRFQLSAVVDALQNQQEKKNEGTPPKKAAENIDDEISNFEELEVASENGDLKATYELAKCYELGTGTDINLEEAFNNYQISALHGFDGAYLDLARCFEKGIGTNVNLQEAKKFKDLASKKSKVAVDSNDNKEKIEVTQNFDSNNKDFPKDTKIIETKIVGLKHRKYVTPQMLDTLKDCEISLSKETTNIYDKYAVKCVAMDKNNFSFHFGYIEMINSKIVTEHLDDFKSYNVNITHVGNTKIKCNIEFFNKEKPIKSQDVKSEDDTKSKDDIKSEDDTKSEDNTKYEQLLILGRYNFKKSNYEKALDAFLKCHKNNFQGVETVETKFLGNQSDSKQAKAWNIMRRENGATVNEIMKASGINSALRVRAMVSEWRKKFIKEYGSKFIKTHDKKSYEKKYSSKGTYSTDPNDLAGYEILKNAEIKKLDLSYQIGLCNYRLSRFQEAFVYFAESSEKNDNVEAFHMMGLMLFFGQHEKMDRVKAKKFFQIAASRDHEESIVMLEENYFEWKKVLR